MRLIQNLNLFVLFFLFVLCSTHKVQRTIGRNCCAFESTFYPRLETSEILLNTIDSLIPIQEGFSGNGYDIKKEDCHFVGFFVYDLVDTLNKEINYKECIKFEDRHVYHSPQEG